MELVLIFALAFSVFAGVSTHQKDLDKEAQMKHNYESALKKPVFKKKVLAKLDGVEIKNLERKG